MEPSSLESAIESLLFVASGPVPVDHLLRTLELPPDVAEAALQDLSNNLQSRGIRLQRKGSDVQLVTAAEHAPLVERFLGLQLASKLSGAALEALAIVAYRQPVTRAQVEAVRGVNSDGVLSTLVARGLISEIGRMETAGRPILYGTTFEFLQHFGLRDLRQLPAIE